MKRTPGAPQRVALRIIDIPSLARATKQLPKFSPGAPRRVALRFSVVFALFLVVMMSSTASAKTPQKFYEDGLAAFNNGDYEIAIEKFEKAYKLSPAPILVYNIAVAHGRLGNLGEATKHAELAELQGLKTPELEKNHARLVAWRVIETSQSFKPIAKKKDEKTVETFSPPPKRNKVAWVTASGMALAIATAGGILWGVAENGLRKHVDDYDTFKNTDPVRANQILRDEIEPRQTFGRIGTIVMASAGTIGIGLLIYALIPYDDKDTVMATPDGIKFVF